MLRKRIYVEYLMPGALFPEEYSERVKKIDPEKQARDAKDNVYAFTYFIAHRRLKIGRMKIIFTRHKIPKEKYHINAVILNKDNYEQYLDKDDWRYEEKVEQLKNWYEEGVILERLGNWQPIGEPGKDIFVKI